MEKFIYFFIIALFISCAANLSDKDSFLLTSDLPIGDFVKESGKKLN